jgi:hypothetical protein
MSLKSRLLRLFAPPPAADPLIEERVQRLAQEAAQARETAAVDRAIAREKLTRIRALAQLRGQERAQHGPE